MTAIIAIVLVAVIAVGAYFVLSGDDNNNGSDDNNGNDNDNGEVNDHYPVTITTQDDSKEMREETIKEKPKRVVLLWSSTAEVMIHFGLEDCIVGVFADPNDTLGMEEHYEAYKKLNFLGETPDMEKARALNPDFILGWNSSFAEPGQWSIGTHAYWNGLGVNTYVWDAPANNIDDYFKHIADLGKMFDCEDKTQAYIDSFQKDIDTIADKTKDVAEKDRPEFMLIMYSETGIIRADPDTKVTGQLGEYAGGNNYYTERAKPSFEDVRGANPDHIFLWIGDFAKFEDKEAAKQHFLSQPGLEGLTSEILVFDFNQIYHASIIDSAVVMEMYKAMYE